MIAPRHYEILTEICNLPTAPYAEQHVIAWLLAWAETRRRHIDVRRDRAGNVYLEYRASRRKKGATPLVLEAHMDHPGFIVRRHGRDGRIEAEFRGGVRPSHFAGARARFWVNAPVAVGAVTPVAATGRWVGAKVESAKPVKGKRTLRVRLVAEKSAERLAAGTLGMWDLPDAERSAGKRKRNLFAARVCDDLAGVAAIVCVLEELIAAKVDAHVIGLCSRAEEVGFAGVLAVCEAGGIPRRSAVIGLETSKAAAKDSGGGVQGGGPIVRVGDRTGIFSAGLTHFLTQAAGHIADDDAAFVYQRKLMDGGTCNSTAFLAYEYDSAGVCVALGNYHNMTVKTDVGWRAGVGGRSGKGIASETIHLGDFAGMVRLLVETARRMKTYRRGFTAVRDRLAKMHREEQRELLYATSDQRDRGNDRGK